MTDRETLDTHWEHIEQLDRKMAEVWDRIDKDFMDRYKYTLQALADQPVVHPTPNELEDQITRMKADRFDELVEIQDRFIDHGLFRNLFVQHVEEQQKIERHLMKVARRTQSGRAAEEPEIGGAC